MFHTPKLLRWRSKLADLYCKWRWGVVWKSSFIWCPSQLTGTHEKIPGIEVYCRWRWSDPWTIDIMNYDNSDVLEIIHCNYKDTDVFRVKIAAAKALLKYKINHPDCVKYFDKL